MPLEKQRERNGSETKQAIVRQRSFFLSLSLSVSLFLSLSLSLSQPFDLKKQGNGQAPACPLPLSPSSLSSANSCFEKDRKSARERETEQRVIRRSKGAPSLFPLSLSRRTVSPSFSLRFFFVCVQSQAYRDKISSYGFKGTKRQWFNQWGAGAASSAERKGGKKAFQVEEAKGVLRERERGGREGAAEKNFSIGPLSFSLPSTTTTTVHLLHQTPSTLPSS